MAAGFSLGTVCYPTVTAAWDAFAANYPKSDAGVVWYISGAPVLTVSGFNFDLRNSGDATTTSNTMILESCNQDDLRIDSSQFYVVMIAACVMFALGFNAST